MATHTTFLSASESEAGNGQGSLSAGRDSEAERRLAMVEDQIRARGIRSPSVLQALRVVPRHRFVPPEQRASAYEDGPVALASGQTVSQPYIVALMTELIRPQRTMKVLEVGTGSGYQAAILAECVGDVYTLEILPDLAASAAALLHELGYRNVHVRVGDGYDGWPEAAPFDAILATAAPEEIPDPLLAQLAVGGALVIPVGSGSQDLVIVTREDSSYRREVVAPVRFVPMTGKARRRP